MKRLYLTLFMCAALPAVVFGEPKAQDPNAAYAQAVANYVQGATKEVQGLKGEVEATIKQATPAAKPRFVPVSEKLAQCERIVADLKTAGQNNFDTIKAMYERTRAELIQALAKARQG